MQERDHSHSHQVYEVLTCCDEDKRQLKPELELALTNSIQSACLPAFLTGMVVRTSTYYRKQEDEDMGHEALLEGRFFVLLPAVLA